MVTAVGHPVVVSDVFVYVDRYSGRYADTLIARQAAALGQPIYTRRNTSHGQSAVHEIAAARRRVVTIIDGRTKALARRFGSIQTSNHVVRALRRELPLHRVAYSFFLWNAHDLVVARRGLADAPPLVVHAGGTDVTGYGALAPLDRRRREATLRGATVVLCTSRFIRDRVLEIAPEARTEVHYVGVPCDVPQASPAGTDADGMVVLLGVARLHPVKGVDRTVRAFARARSQTSVPMRLDLVGDGSLQPELERLVSSLALEEHVRFLGHMPPEEVPRVMASSHVFVQHSVTAPDGAQEALGASIVEAGAAGLPVIASRSGGIVEAVDEGRSAILVEPGDVDAMADAIVRLAEDPARRARLGTAGRAFAAMRHAAPRQDSLLVERLHEIARAG